MTDNMTAVSAITKQGPTHSHICNEIARKIWLWAIELNIWLNVAHVPGVENIVADQESRVFKDEIEWILHDEQFQRIVNKFGMPQLDTFATRLNNKVERFHAWKPDPQAEAIDTFMTSWKNAFFYAFPPFCLIGKVLKKVIWEKAQGIILVPDWPTKITSILASRRFGGAERGRSE